MAQVGEEETISNIANFLESTKPVQKVTDKISLTKVNGDTHQSDESLTASQHKGIHKLPVSVMTTRPTQPQKRNSSISVNKMSSFSGISISRMPMSSAGEDVQENCNQNNVNKSPQLSSSISINRVDEQSRSIQSSVPTLKDPPTTNSLAESFTRSSRTEPQGEQPEPTKYSVPSSDPSSKSFDLKPSTTVFLGTVSVNELLKLTEKLNSDNEVSSLVLKFMSEDSLRNLCDGITALQLSGENDCTDLDTLSLYQAALNIIALSTNLDKMSKEEFHPLTNLSAKTSFCSDLLKLVYKEPNLKGHINGKLGESKITMFEQLVNKHSSEGLVFIKTDILETLTMYHKLRNIALKYVLSKLRNVYMKMKPMFAAMNIPDEEFKSSVSRLATLVTADWVQEVQISEETGYDFNFLITIMKHVKKSKEGPKPATSTQSQIASREIDNLSAYDASNREKKSVVLNPALSSSPTRNLPNESSPSVVESPQLTRPKVSALPGNVSLSSVSIQKVSPSKVKEQSNIELQNNSEPPCHTQEPLAAQGNPNNGVMIRKVSSKDPTIEMRQLKAPQNTVSVAITQEQSKINIESSPNLLYTPKSCISVDTLHNLKNFLEDSKEPQERVIRGVGEQAFREFCNLVSTLEDRTLVIEDINIRTLYYTILNFSRFPVNYDMKQYEPLSNFALKLQNFIDLRNLFRKDQNIAKIVAEKLEADELDNFDRHVESLLTREKDFIQVNQEINIIIYHRIRNCLIDVTMSRLMVVHSKISSLDTSSAPGIFADSVKMLSSLMATHYNGQVLMMEKIKFNFDFLTTILDYLKKLNPNQGDVNIKNVSTLRKHDPTQIMIDNLCQEVSDPTTFQSLENILSQKLSRAWLNTIKSITDTGNMTMVQKRGVYSIKNAVFLYKNNLRCQDVPLTNISLEVSKIISLSRFINKDFGIKDYIGKKFGEVAPKELEALVAAHTERGDEFVLKFVEKNINLYHSLRNSALEKILKQITLVHSKFKNREVPESAKNSSQYHAAIKRLEDIVTADTVTRMIIIEEQKFDFDFLSTILLVWKTENARLAEAAAKAALPAPVASPILTPALLQPPSFSVQSQNVRSRQVMLQSQVRADEEDVDDPSPTPADVISIDDDQDMTTVPRMAWPGPVRPKTAASVVTPRMPRPVATVSPQTRMSSSGDLGRGQGGFKSIVKVATVANPMQVIDGQGELPIRTKCTLCNDRSSENMLQLIHHYALVHFREDIGKYIRTDVCPCCSQTFENRNELVKHVGLVHGAINLVLTKTERWICDFCKKEFLTEEFLKKHLIKGHLEKKFEQTFLALSENNEILCQFCDTTFTVKKNLFCHIGIDHNKLEELLPNHKKDDQDNIKCRHCDLETGLQSLKSHYIKTHYRDTFQKYCQELSVLTDDHSCKYCLVEYSEDEGLLEHLGLEHNLIYRLIANFQAKNVSAEFKECPKLRSLSELAEMKSSRQADTCQDPDPLLTETVFVDTSKSSSPVKPVIRIVSPSKLKSQSKHAEEASKKNLKGPLGQVVTQKVSLPTHPVFEEYKSFCSNLTNDQEAQLIMRSSFIKFSMNVFIQFLDRHCQLKANIVELEATMKLFEMTYPEVKLRSDPTILKFLALREYLKYCENLKTTPEKCNPMHLVIFLSQLLAKPDFQPNQPGLEWLVRKISYLHDKIDGKTLLVNKKITDFFDAVGMKLSIPEEEKECEPESLEELTVKTPTPKVVSSSRTANKISENVQSKPVDTAFKESKPNSAPAASSTSLPSVDKDIEADTRSEDRTEVKTEKCEKSDQTVTLSEEPEVIELGDDDDNVEYRYYCLECEGCPGGVCDHTQHARRPIPYDIRPHFQKTGHVGVSPMEKFLDMKPMNDVSYSFNHGASVRKQWKDLVLSGSYKPLPYSGVKRCKWNNCTETFVDAVDALKHIKDAHLKHTQKKVKIGVNASVKRKSDVTPGNSNKNSRT